MYKEMYEAEFEFEEGWGLRQNPFQGGMDIFWSSGNTLFQN